MYDAFHIVTINLPLLGNALLVTVELNLASIALALVLGAVMGIGRVYGGRWLDYAFGFVIDVMRSIPILVIMVWVFFGLPLLLGMQDFPAFLAGVLALGIHSGAYIAEIVRGGIVSVRRGQMQAALALGMSWPQAIGRIILVSPTSNAYAQELGRGPWYRYAIDLLLLSPWPTLLGIAALGPAALRLRERKPGDAVVWLGLALASLAAAYAPFTKNVRYVSLCEVPLRALAAWLVFSLTGADSGRGRLALAAACIALLCLSGWLSFRAIFVDAGLFDPMTAPLLYLRGLSPHP